MEFNIVKTIPTSTYKVVDVLPYTVMPSSSAAISSISRDSALLYLEDLRGHIIELSLNLDDLLELRSALCTGVNYVKSIITTKTRNIMLGKNAVFNNPEVSNYIDATNFIGDHKALLEHVYSLDECWEIGGYYLIPNGCFYILVNINSKGDDIKDLALIYKSTLISTLISLQSKQKFGAMEMHLLEFQMDYNNLVQDQTIVHFNDSVLLNHEGKLYVSRREVVEIALEAIESGNISIDIAEALRVMGLVHHECADYSKIRLVRSGSARTKNIETYIEFDSYYGSPKPSLKMVIDGTIYLGSSYGSVLKMNSAYLDRPHCMTLEGVGTPPSLLKDKYKVKVETKQFTRPSLTRSRLFS